MKYVLAVILAVGLSSGVCLGAEQLELKDQKDRESYSLGYALGQHLRARGLAIDPDVYAAAIKDALTGTNPALREDDMGAIISGIEKRDSERQQGAATETAKKNLEKAKAFLEENEKKEGIKTLPSGIQYTVLKEGSGKMPKTTDEVTVNLRATLTDGTEIGSTYSGKPLTSKVDFISFGWADALKLMKEGSTWQVFVPPELAYGTRDRGNVPGDSVIIFEVELLAVK